MIKAILLLVAFQAFAQEGFVTTPAAAREAICAPGFRYPEQPILKPPTAPLPATSGMPKVEQWRAGKLVATYGLLGGTQRGTPPNNTESPLVSAGPFNRQQYRNWRDGDLFLVYPAIYSGSFNFPWLGPLADTPKEYTDGVRHAPRNITIRGVTENGFRPVIRRVGGEVHNTLGGALVYLQGGENIVWENIDVDGAGIGSIGKALFYLYGNRNVTIRDSRIGGARPAVANGIFGTDNSGTLLFERVTLYKSGGDSGPEHNIYITGTSSDPDFTVRFVDSWSFDAFYGHTFKSRAQVNIIENSVLLGSTPARLGELQAEAFLIDAPYGGRLTVRNNVIVKNNSGDNSNGISLFFAGEIVDGRPQSVTIEGNSFVAYARTWDSANHPLYPLRFRPEWGLPGSATFRPQFSIKDNSFVGFCPDTGASSAHRNYRGTSGTIAGFADLGHDLRLKVPAPPPAKPTLTLSVMGADGVPVSYTLELSADAIAKIKALLGALNR